MKLRFKTFSLLLFFGMSFMLLSCNKDDSNNSPTPNPNGPGGQIENFGFMKALIVQNNDTILHEVTYENSQIIDREAGEELYEIYLLGFEDSSDALITISGRINGTGTYPFNNDQPDNVAHSLISYSDQNYRVYIPSLDYDDSFCTLKITEYGAPFPALVQKPLKGNFSGMLYDSMTDSKVEIIDGEFELYVTSWTGL